MSHTVFVVAEPKSHEGEAIVSVFFDQEEAKEDYDNAVATGEAHLNVGLHLVKLEGINDDDLNRLFTPGEDLSDIVDEKFEGFNATYLESFESQASDWVEGSLDVNDEEFSSADEDYLVY